MREEPIIIKVLVIQFKRDFYQRELAQHSPRLLWRKPFRTTAEGGHWSPQKESQNHDKCTSSGHRVDRFSRADPQLDPSGEILWPVEHAE